jgi:inosine/xanthosine triphosphatase
MDEIKVCVGSINPTKIEAAKQGFSKYFKNFQFYNTKAESKVSNQPIGMEEIIEGAINRARDAITYLTKELESQCNNYGVGIESGLIKVPQARTDYMDLQFCAIIDDDDNITLGSGNAFEHPQSVIREILTDNTKEIGVIIGKLANNMNLKNETGAISFLSKYSITRTDILTHAVICALIPRINKEIYE